ncbi:MAG: hypothetical protein HYR55_05370 [Acidobacteria bacterium]|nr:hypothetical protein [Acidobacteriota bacterium]MBI3657826.1 hypothetical protein [Acidobacteriota bacterium]
MRDGLKNVLEDQDTNPDAPQTDFTNSARSLLNTLEELVSDALGADPSKAVAAEASLRSWPTERMVTALTSTVVSAQTLSHIGLGPGWKDSIRAAAVCHTAFPSARLQEMLKQPDPDTQELLMERARRLQDDGLLRQMHASPATSPKVRERLENLIVETLTAQAGQKGPTEERFSDDKVDSISEAENTQDNPSRETIFQRLNKMTVAGKVRAALFGSKEERMILVKSMNRIIAGAVLTSPKTSDTEVELISQMRNVHLDVLTTIAITPAWSRKRTIALNLIRNPRTPVALSLRLLKQITSRDMQFVARDRGIPEVIRRTATRAVLAAKKRE